MRRHRPRLLSDTSFTETRARGFEHFKSWISCFREPYTIEHACKRGISPSEHACIGVRTGEGLDALEHRHPKEKQTDAGGKSYEEKGKATRGVEPTIKASCKNIAHAVNRFTTSVYHQSNIEHISLGGINVEYTSSCRDLSAWRSHLRTCEATRTPFSRTYETKAACDLTGAPTMLSYL